MGLDLSRNTVYIENNMVVTDNIVHLHSSCITSNWIKYLINLNTKNQLFYKFSSKFPYFYSHHKREKFANTIAYTYIIKEKGLIAHR